MSKSESQVRLDNVLARLVPAPEQFTLDAWARRLERFEGRAIEWANLDLQPGFFGTCLIVEEASEGLSGVRYPQTEYVVYANSLSPTHREHVKAHELAHIALGHPTLVLTAEEFANWFSRPRRLPQVSHVCCRALSPTDRTLDEEREQEAERLTRIIYQRVLLFRQCHGLTQFSSQQHFDRGLQRLGIG